MEDKESEWMSRQNRCRNLVLTFINKSFYDDGPCIKDDRLGNLVFFSKLSFLGLCLLVVFNQRQKSWN